MKMRQISCISLIFLALANGAIAGQSASPSLHTEREQVIKEYLLDLQNADYKDIAQLFEKDGVVVSTSRGKVNAKNFFYSFLPHVVLANTELHQSFVSSIDGDHYAARFHLNFKLKEGETGNGEYMDEFIFVDHSAKLSAVYMFENLKFEDASNPAS